jgi:hypothetical protein
VIIAAGSASAAVIIKPRDDSRIESSETVVLTLASTAAYVVGTPSSATVTILDKLPSVTIKATDNSAKEPSSDQGTFTITRTGNISESLTVSYAVTGTATNGVDYALLAGTITIAAGSSSTKLMVLPLDDRIKEKDETIIVTLALSEAYTLGSTTAKVTLHDND